MLLPTRLLVEIDYGGGNKKDFIVMYFNQTYDIVGLLFPSANPQHTDEIPEFKTLESAIEGAEGWKWDFSP